MANKNNEQNKSFATNDSEKEDLDLADLGITSSMRVIGVDPKSYPMIILAILSLGIITLLFTNIARSLTAAILALLFALALDPVIVKIQDFRKWKVFSYHYGKKKSAKENFVIFLLLIFENEIA